MTEQDPFREGLERSLELLALLAREHAALSQELEQSLRPFFQGPFPDAEPAVSLLHARRHLEWFLLERHSPCLFGVPVERLLEAWRARAEEAAIGAEGLLALQESFTGAFQVTGMGEGGVWLRDLAGLGDYALAGVPQALSVGDLLVGRLYPAPDGLHRASPALGLFRDPGLTAAVERDLAQAREGGGSKVLRLSQLDLERLFWDGDREEASPEGTGEDAVDAARTFLEEQGLDAGSIDAILAQLRAAPFDARRLVHGAGDVLGSILDELAFDSGVDLVGARERLTLAWAQLGAPAPAPKPLAPKPDENSEDDLGAKALAEFNAGRAAGRDLDELFQSLARDLELDDKDEPDPGELSPAPDFPGVVGAMIEEFRWERSLGDDPLDADESRELDSLGEYAARIGRFEELDAAELLRFTSFWIPERADHGPERVRHLVGGLIGFCRWAEEAHEMPLASEFEETLEGLRESLPRVMRINGLLEEPQAGDTGELYEVQGDAQGRYDHLVDRHGESHHARPSAGLADVLRPGDRLRGAISLEGELTVYRCYPPESAGLLA